MRTNITIIDRPQCGHAVLYTGMRSGRANSPRLALVCAEQQECVWRKVSGVFGPLKTIGLISDTHGLLRPEAVGALAGVQRIIHAGDIGSLEVLAALRSVAPVDAVRGNNDKGRWAAKIPASLTLNLAGVCIHILHDVKEMESDPRDAGFDVVISGHSHRPAVTERDGVIFVNPGSAGPRRFTLPVTVGYLDLGGKARVAARILKIL